MSDLFSGDLMISLMMKVYLFLVLISYTSRIKVGVSIYDALK